MTKQEFKRTYKALQAPRDAMLEYGKGSNYSSGFLNAYGAFMREWNNPCFTAEFVKDMIDGYKDLFEQGKGNDYKAGFIGCMLIIMNNFRG